jgi:Uma2 family endonuclease
MWSPALRPPDGPQARTLSLEQWIGLAEDEGGELVNGRLVEEEVPDPIHGLAVSWLIALVRAWLADKGGFVFDSDVKVIVGGASGRKPDVSIFFPGRPAPPRRGALKEPPDIAIEVISATPRDERRDRVEKMGEYAAAGIRYYWLVDPALGSFEIFELGSSQRYARALGTTEGLLTMVPGCEGLTVDLDGLWKELGRLAPETND